MRIKFEKYNPEWAQEFEGIKSDLTEAIGFLNPEIEHIGSTSVEGLSAKPIIDILVGVKSPDNLDKVPLRLMEKDYIYFEKYNEVMPYRRFFVKYKVDPTILSIPLLIDDKYEIPENSKEHDYRLAHIHVLPYNSEHWIRHIAFRDYIRAHADIMQEYQKLKEELSLKEWVDGNDYNEGKDSFIKKVEHDAIKWYNKVNDNMKPKDILNEWIKLFNAADAEGISELYHDDAVNFQVPENPVAGRDAIYEKFQNEFALAKMTCIPENIFEDGEWAILEWRDPLGLRGCGFFHIVGDKITFQRGYWDKLSFLRQHGLPIT